jgi:hypothetical protein
MQSKIEDLISERRAAVDEAVASYAKLQEKVYKEPYLTKKVESYRSKQMGAHRMWEESLRSLLVAYNGKERYYDIYGPQSPYDCFTEITDIRERALADFVNISGVQVTREKRQYSDPMEGTCTMLRCHLG